MMRLLYGSFFFCLFACTNSDAPSHNTAGSQTIHSTNLDTIAGHVKPVAVNGCYQMVLKKDTATMAIRLKDSTVTGTLAYRFYQKDKNEGIIKGVLRDSLIIVDYTFNAEGMTSVREAVFKIKNDTLLQGVGAITEQQNKQVFVNKNTLLFDRLRPFVKAPCTK